MFIHKVRDGGGPVPDPQAPPRPLTRSRISITSSNFQQIAQNSRCPVPGCSSSSSPSSGESQPDVNNNNQNRGTGTSKDPYMPRILHARRRILRKDTQNNAMSTVEHQITHYLKKLFTEKVNCNLSGTWREVINSSKCKSPACFSITLKILEEAATLINQLDMLTPDENNNLERFNDTVLRSSIKINFNHLEQEDNYLFDTFGWDIYQVELKKEQKFYKDLKPNVFFSDQPRRNFIQWLVGLAEKTRNPKKKLTIHHETFHLAVFIIDSFLKKSKENGQHMYWPIELIAAASFYIASKKEEVYPPSLETIKYNFNLESNVSFQKHEIIEMEFRIHKCLSFDINAPTAVFFLEFFACRLSFSNRGCKNLVLRCGREILKRALYEEKLIANLPSHKARIALKLSVEAVMSQIANIRMVTPMKPNESLTSYLANNYNTRTNSRLMFNICFNIFKQYLLKEIKEESNILP